MTISVQASFFYQNCRRQDLAKRARLLGPYLDAEGSNSQEIEAQCCAVKNRACMLLLFLVQFRTVSGQENRAQMSCVRSSHPLSYRICFV